MSLFQEFTININQYFLGEGLFLGDSLFAGLPFPYLSGDEIFLK